MKLINLFNGEIDNNDAFELVYNFINDEERLSFRKLFKENNNRIDVESIMEHLYFLGEKSFSQYFTGYTKSQVQFIFENKELVNKEIKKQVIKLGNKVSTILIYGASPNSGGNLDFENTEDIEDYI